jgi:outer membrane protein assembly factor BamD (BamD/ComL family)
MRILLIALLSLGLTAGCSQSENQNTVEQNELTLQDRVEQQISEANFDQALSIVNEASPENAEALREQIHLQHGIHLIYNADPSEMRESANNALREFIKVLEINPENEKARAEIDQILAIYRSFPDRQPEQEILDELQDMGFQI